VVVPQVPISCLQWEHRLPLILQEIREADADIICLQELNHFGESAGRWPQQKASHASSRHGQRRTDMMWPAGEAKRPAHVAQSPVVQQGLESPSQCVNNPPVFCGATLPCADVLAAALVPEGYSCFFRAKKPSPATKFGFPADGIALFYRHSRFSCSPAPEGEQQSAAHMNVQGTAAVAAGTGGCLLLSISMGSLHALAA
jgi:hypothetical protein